MTVNSLYRLYFCESSFLVQPLLEVLSLLHTVAVQLPEQWGHIWKFPQALRKDGVECSDEICVCSWTLEYMDFIVCKLLLVHKGYEAGYDMR